MTVMKTSILHRWILPSGLLGFLLLPTGIAPVNALVPSTPAANAGVSQCPSKDLLVEPKMDYVFVRPGDQEHEEIMTKFMRTKEMCEELANPCLSSASWEEVQMDKSEIRQYRSAMSDGTVVKKIKLSCLIRPQSNP